MARTMTEAELEHWITRSLHAENVLYEMREKGAHPNDIALAERFRGFYESKITRGLEEWGKQCGR